MTIYERKNGFLLIEVFSNLFNTQNYGHLVTGGLFIFVGIYKTRKPFAVPRCLTSMSPQIMLRTAFIS